MAGHEGEGTVVVEGRGRPSPHLVEGGNAVLIGLDDAGRRSHGVHLHAHVPGGLPNRPRHGQAGQHGTVGIPQFRSDRIEDGHGKAKVGHHQGDRLVVPGHDGQRVARRWVRGLVQSFFGYRIG